MPRRRDRTRRPIYRLVEVQLWRDERFTQLSPLRPSGQALWLYLLTNPHTSVVPGLYTAGRAQLAEELGWTQRQFDQAFAEIEREGMARADWQARVVWLPKGLRTNNVPPNPNVVKAWRRAYDELAACPLKLEAMDAIRAFIGTEAPDLLATFDAGSKAGPPPSGGPGGPLDTAKRDTPGPAHHDAQGARSLTPCPPPLQQQFQVPVGGTIPGTVDGTVSPVAAATVGGTVPLTVEDTVNETVGATVPLTVGENSVTGVTDRRLTTTTARARDGSSSRGAVYDLHGYRVAALELLELWRQHGPTHDQVPFAELMDEAHKLLRQALAVRSLDDWERLFRHVSANDYLAGRTPDQPRPMSLWQVLRRADAILAGDFDPRPAATSTPAVDLKGSAYANVGWTCAHCQKTHEGTREQKAAGWCPTAEKQATRDAKYRLPQ